MWNYYHAIIMNTIKYGCFFEFNEQTILIKLYTIKEQILVMEHQKSWCRQIN